MDAADVMTLDEAASTDLIETPAEQPVYDPGTLEDDTRERGDRTDLTFDQAMQEFGDGDSTSPSADKPIAVLDNQPLTLDQLVQGYAAGQDFENASRGLQARYGQVIAAANDVAQGAAALAEFLSSQLPAAPSSSLSIVNPAEFVRQQAAYDEGHKIIARVLHTAQVARQQAAAAAAQQRSEMIAVENQRLIECFPECGNPEGREQFFDRVREVAYQCDFSEQELRQVIDHRMFRLAHMAMASLEKAQQRRQKPARPAKPKPKPSNQTVYATIDDAMELEVD